jgi:hypothetical protein
MSEENQKVQDNQTQGEKSGIFGGLSSVKNTVKAVSGIAADGVGSVAKKAAGIATDEQTKKIAAEMLLHSGKHIAVSTGKLAGVLVLFVLTNLLLSVFLFYHAGLFGKLVGVPLGFAFMIYAVIRAYTVVRIDTARAVYDQFLTPLLRQTCTQITERASQLDTNGKTQDQVTDFLSALPEQFGNRCPRLIRNGISFLLSRIPVSEILSNMEQTISNGNQEQAGKMLFDNINGYVHKSIFQQNKLSAVFWILLANVLSLLLIGIIF